MIEIACLYPNALGDDLASLGRCREAGYEAVQLHPRAFTDPEELSQESSPSAVLEAVAAAGLRIAAWGGYRPLIGDAETVEKHVAYLGRLLRFVGRAAAEAPDLATGIVCTETGTPDPECPARQQWGQLVDALGRLASVAEEVGAKVAIEPTRSHIIRDAETALRVVEDVGSSALGICYDPANIIHKGEPVRASFEPLRAHIFLSHAKDVAFARDGSVETYPPAGEGDVPYDEYFELLGQLPSPHTLAVEYARSEEQLRRVAAFLSDLRG